MHLGLMITVGLLPLRLQGKLTRHNIHDGSVKIAQGTCQCVQVVLVDPPGSGLYNKVTRGVMYAREEAENTRLRNPCDTITEGVGVNRITANFKQVSC